MNILLIGSGGREHALARALAQSPSTGKVYAAPGNPGIAHHAELVPLRPGDAAAVVDFCREQAIALVVIGPEQPLIDGLADTLRTAGIAVFGPDAAAARLEGSKAFTKALCAEQAIPTARFRHHPTLESARTGLEEFGWPLVIKADGLAAGKGVVIVADRAEGEAALNDLFSGRYGGHEDGVVIEECLSGPEASLFALADGASARLFATAQDHKRVGDGDTGPNTGGMGAFSPARVLTPALTERAMREILVPTLKAMEARGTPFIGVLYAGLMLTADGPKLIEYNVRFGDPETEVMLPRFTGDFAALCHAVATGRLAGFGEMTFTDQPAVTVVVAAQGYPDQPKRGGAITGIEDAEASGAIVFQAGTRLDDDGVLRATGGRVLAVTALGADMDEARASAYRAVDSIDYADGFARRDIAASQ